LIRDNQVEKGEKDGGRTTYSGRKRRRLLGELHCRSRGGEKPSCPVISLEDKIRLASYTLNAYQRRRGSKKTGKGKTKQEANGSMTRTKNWVS